MYQLIETEPNHRWMRQFMDQNALSLWLIGVAFLFGLIVVGAFI